YHEFRGPESVSIQRQVPRGRSMSHIRVRVTITNSMDETRFRRGEIAEAEVRSCEADAVVDLEAVWSVIPPQIKEQLGVSDRGNLRMEGADGQKGLVTRTGP